MLEERNRAYQLCLIYVLSNKKDVISFLPLEVSQNSEIFAGLFKTSV